MHMIANTCSALVPSGIIHNRDRAINTDESVAQNDHFSPRCVELVLMVDAIGKAHNACPNLGQAWKVYLIHH